MSIGQSDVPEHAQRYLEFLGLIGVLRVTLFEVFEDRKYWNEKYFDLFLTMLIRHLRGSVVTMEDMTAAISGVSHSTKVRMIEEARRDGLIISANRSEVALNAPLANTGARKVFSLADSTIDVFLERLNMMMGDVRHYAETHPE